MNKARVWLKIPVYECVDEKYPKYSDSQIVLEFQNTALIDGFYYAEFTVDADRINELLDMPDVERINPDDIPKQ